MRAKVIATFELGGFHQWPDAERLLPVVGYLSDLHRHLFHFRVECSVLHHDRQVEFHMLRAAAVEAVEELATARLNGELLFGSRSCEMIATELGACLLSRNWPVVAVEVWEDRENGARVDW